MKIDRRVSSAHQIYEKLRADIIAFKLVPGATVSKREMAAQFGTSETPVRDALLRLEAEGLIDIVPQSKTAVSLIDVQHAREVHFLRLSVEVEVIREVTRKFKGKGLDNLDARIERLRFELKTGDQYTFRVADNEFHGELFKMAGVEGLMSVIDQRRGHYDRIRGLYLRKIDRRQDVIKEHRAIVDAVALGDPENSERVVRMHLGKSLAALDEIRDLDPEYFA